MLSLIDISDAAFGVYICSSLLALPKHSVFLKIIICVSFIGHIIVADPPLLLGDIIVLAKEELAIGAVINLAPFIHLRYFERVIGVKDYLPAND